VHNLESWINYLLL